MKNAVATKQMMGKPAAPLCGIVRAPGDKSISHRALIFGALAAGTTNITGLLEGDDILHTAGAMRAFGARIAQKGSGKWQVIGVGKQGFQNPKSPVNFGNAGTGARLVMGAAAGFDIQVEYRGDESLSSRPMGRVLTPLAQMGAHFKSADGKLPLQQTKGGNLQPIRFTPPHASAQVKSALLLAGLGASGTTEIIETKLTRDHSENMLRAFGVNVQSKSVRDGQSVSITGPATLTATNVNVPGDPSSAAFLMASALIVPGSDITIENVMMNPSRTGLFEVLIAMGGHVRANNFRRSGGETIADIHVKHSKLRGVTVTEARVPSMVDEYPILAVLAAYADGTTQMQGLAELRVKESDRLAATHALLVQNGVKAEIIGDRLSVTGGAVRGGACVPTHHDHRIAMSALILGLGADQPVSIDDDAMIATSFPDFFDLMHSIGAPIAQATLETNMIVIAIDGTFSSGKGTLAKKLAAHYGFAYLDTGKLYRAVAARALKDGIALGNGPNCAALAEKLQLCELDNPLLKSGDVGAAASKIAVHPEVRAALLAFQKNFATNPNTNLKDKPYGGAILDGRDIGTVICPDANVKLYVDAAPEVRAKRRHAELTGYGETISYEQVLAQLTERDHRDMNRALAPLKPAANAHLLDTTKLAIDPAFEAAKSIIDAVLR